MVDEMVDPAPISSNQSMENLDIYVISNQNKGIVLIDIEIVLT